MPGIIGRIKSIEILGVQVILGHTQGIRKSLIMHDLTCSEEFDGILYVGVIHKTEDIVIGHAGLLLC